MSDQPEMQGNGSPIYRHQPREGDHELASGDAESIDAISEHIEKHIGKISGVFHEIVSPLVHIDLHLVEATQERPFHTVVTSGMSDRPMKVPPGVEGLDRAELMLCLPPEWSLQHEDFNDENVYWPFRCLKKLARLPHEYETWLGFGHTVGNGNPPAPFANNTKMCCSLIAAPLTAPEEFNELTLPSGDVVHFYAVIPIYLEEMNLKMDKGTEALFPGFDRHQVSEILNAKRPNVAKSQSFLGRLFGRG